MDPPQRRRRVAVIGGGIAGLVAADAVLRARSDIDVTVFEGSPEIGGKLRLGEIAGVTVDLGAESLLNRRPEGVELIADVGLSGSLVHPHVTEAGIWTRGSVRSLPPTLMGIPADPDLARRRGIISRRGALRASLESRLPSPDLTTDVGVGVLVARRMGAEVRDRLVEPLLGGVYAGRADEISLHAALPQVVAGIREHGSLLAAARAAVVPVDSPVQRPPFFAGIAGGVGRLPLELARDIVERGGSVRRDATVRELHRTTDGWRLVVGSTTESSVVDADAVVIAVPAAPASRLLRDVAPTASIELGRVESASMALVTVAFEAGRVGVELVGSGFLVPPVDGRVIKAATFVSQKWSWLAGDVVVVRCSIGRFREEAELQRPDTELVESAVLDLREAVGLDAPLLDALVTRWGGALPQYAVGHVERVRRINEAVAAVPGLDVCGAAYDGVGIPAVIANARAAATRVVAAVGAADTMGA
jgi:oxygen-dependent protoporphyrinogen oxidase